MKAVERAGREEQEERLMQTATCTPAESYISPPESCMVGHFRGASAQASVAASALLSRGESPCTSHWGFGSACSPPTSTLISPAPGPQGSSDTPGALAPRERRASLGQAPGAGVSAGRPATDEAMDEGARPGLGRTPVWGPPPSWSAALAAEPRGAAAGPDDAGDQSPSWSPEPTLPAASCAREPASPRGGHTPVWAPPPAWSQVLISTESQLSQPPPEVLGILGDDCIEEACAEGAAWACAAGGAFAPEAPAPEVRHMYTVYVYIGKYTCTSYDMHSYIMTYQSLI